MEKLEFAQNKYLNMWRTHTVTGDRIKKGDQIEATLNASQIEHFHGIIWEHIL